MADKFHDETKFKMPENKETLKFDPVCLCVNCSLKYSVELVKDAVEFDIPCPRCGEAKGVVMAYALGPLPSI